MTPWDLIRQLQVALDAWIELDAHVASCDDCEVLDLPCDLYLAMQETAYQIRLEALRDAEGVLAKRAEDARSNE